MAATGKSIAVVNGAPKAWKPAGSASRNKTTKAHAKNKGTTKAAKTARPNGVTAATADKLMRLGAQSERNRLRASGALEQNKKHHSTKAKGKNKKHKNGSTSVIPSFLRNPLGIGRSGALEVVKTGGIGLAGGAASKIIAAILLAIGDTFAPTWTAKRYASPIVTFISAIVAVPLVFAGLFKFSKQTTGVMTSGGVLFAFGEAFALAAGRDVIGETANKARAEVRQLTSSVSGAASNAATGTAANTNAATNMGRRGEPLRFSPRGEAAGGVGRWL